MTAEALKITTDELKSVIADRLRDMAARVSPDPGSMLQQCPEPSNFLRTNLLNELEDVRTLIGQLRHGATHTIVTTWPQRIFTDAENAAAVQEVFTERGV